jgi:hypothetical protein
MATMTVNSYVIGFITHTHKRLVIRLNKLSQKMIYEETIGKDQEEHYLLKIFRTD